MSLKHVTGSCHCEAVRYEAELDLSKGTIRCNCSICTKARAWFTFVNDEHFHLLADEDNMSVYQWTSPNLTRKPWVVPDLPLSAKHAECAFTRWETQSSWAANFTRSQSPRSTTLRPTSWPLLH